MRRKSWMTPTPVGWGFAWRNDTPLMAPLAPAVVRFTTAGTDRSSRHSTSSRAAGTGFRVRDTKLRIGSTSAWDGRDPADAGRVTPGLGAMATRAGGGTTAAGGRI